MSPPQITELLHDAAPQPTQALDFARATTRGRHRRLRRRALQAGVPLVAGVGLAAMIATDSDDHVVWIEVPPAGVRYDGPPLDPRLERLNEAVADHLGCDLQPWALRDVETYGSAAGDHVNGDWVHPTPLGRRQIAENAAKLTAADVCVPRRLDPEPPVEPAACAVVVYTPPSASAARDGELCVPTGLAIVTVILVHGGGGYEGNRSHTDARRDAHLAAGRATFSIDYALLDPATAGDGPLWPCGGRILGRGC